MFRGLVKQQAADGRYSSQFNRCCCKRRRWQTGREMDVWCQISPLASVCCQWGEDNQKRAEQCRENTERKKGNRRKRSVGQDAEYTVFHLYLIKSAAALIWAEGISPNILQSWKAAGILVPVWLKLPVLSTWWGTREKSNFQVSQLGLLPENKNKTRGFFFLSGSYSPATAAFLLLC